MQMRVRRMAVTFPVQETRLNRVAVLTARGSVAWPHGVVQQSECELTTMTSDLLGGLANARVVDRTMGRIASGVRGSVTVAAAICGVLGATAGVSVRWLVS